MLQRCATHSCHVTWCDWGPDGLSLSVMAPPASAEDVTPVQGNGSGRHGGTFPFSRGERWQIVLCWRKRHKRRARRRLLFCCVGFDIFSRLPTPQMNSVRASNVSRRPRRVSRPRPVQPERNHQERGDITLPSSLLNSRFYELNRMHVSRLDSFLCDLCWYTVITLWRR